MVGAPGDDAATSAIDARVHTILDQRLKDQKLVEIEIAQAAADRLTGWAKTFGYWAAALLGVLALTLAIWGIASFADFKSKVNTTREEVLNTINKTKSDLEQLGTDADRARSKFEQVRRELGTLPDDVARVRSEVVALQRQLGSVPQQLTTLESKVNRIEERIGFVKTAALTPELQKRLTAALIDFRQYCRNAGFAIRSGTPNVRVEEVPTIDGKPVEGAVAFYLPEKEEMVVAAKYTSDPTIILREYMHRLLLRPGTGNMSDGSIAVESGLACYYPASFRNDSKCGFYDLTQATAFTTPYQPVGASAWGLKVWGSAFWTLRGVMGREACDLVLQKFWTKLDTGHTAADYPRYAVSQLLAAYRESGGREEDKVRAIFSSRGLEI